MSVILEARIPGTRVVIDEEFIIVALPDTQNYSAELDGGTKEMFRAQAQWVADNAGALNIRCVLHLGDIVQNFDNTTEWENAEWAMEPIEDSGIPYVLCLGNHDNKNEPLNPAKTILFNQHFGLSKFSTKPYWISSQFAGIDNDCSAIRFTGGGLNWLVLSFEYDQVLPDGVNEFGSLAWAQDLIDTYPDHMVICLAHATMSSGGGGRSFPQGDYLWHGLGDDNENVFWFPCGHNDIPGHISGVLANALPWLMESNYQFDANGGDGYMRIYTIRTLAQELFVQTYSPHLDAYLTGPTNQFTESLDITEAVQLEGTAITMEAPIPGVAA